MASTWSLSKGLAAAVVTSAAAFGLCPAAAADPAAPQPNPNQQLPGLPALTQLSPIIQQAASNPGQATQLLMAAAQAFVHNPAAPAESKNVAASVNRFVAEPTNPGSPALGCRRRPGSRDRTGTTRATAWRGARHAGASAYGIDPAHVAGPARLLRRVEHRPLRLRRRLLRRVEHRPLRLPHPHRLPRRACTRRLLRQVGHPRRLRRRRRPAPAPTWPHLRRPRLRQPPPDSAPTPRPRRTSCTPRSARIAWPTVAM
ncbi:putative conserved alanine and proline rich protein [Mycobacterium kansasii 732]|nr:putative conserved alanine and proline rich protein [Mycobacterium kansasii 732]